MDELPASATRRAEALALASASLSGFIRSDARAAALLASDGDLSDPREEIRSGFTTGGIEELRLTRRRLLAEIAARDVAGELDLAVVGTALSDLADACIGTVMSSLDSGGLAVIAMGKLGGRELNYSSDIDLMFVSDGDTRSATSAATELVNLLGQFSAQGQAYRIDLNLRPEGRSGALVRSLDAYLEYYRRWAKEWEFQALIKARACAGDPELGARFIEATRSFVFAKPDPDRVQEIRRMKQRVEDHASRGRRGQDDSSDVKLGPGGIRDIEFSVQLLQLVHGPEDETVRSGNTLAALRALVGGGYVADEDGAGLEVAYRWLRNVEHRLQLWREQQTHHLPNDAEGRARLARSLGFRDTPALGAQERFLQAHRGVLLDVRGRFEKLFYRPMIEALAEGSGAGLGPEGLRQRLRVLGFRDVERAARTLQSLVSGTSRRARLVQLLSAPFLRFLATQPKPDEGLFSFLRVAEGVSERLDLLGGLRDNPPGLEFLAEALGSGRILGDLLLQVPEELASIADPGWNGAPKARERLQREADASLLWRGPDRKLEGLRRFKRREMLSIALGDIRGFADEVDVGQRLSDLADVCLQAALGDPGIPFAVIAMGKLGGRELGYSSDVDVMFVYEGDHQRGDAIASELMKAIGEVTPEGQAFQIDAGLRPEGRAGPIARSLDAYLEYYERWARPWEHQALLRARFAAGDSDLGRRFISATRIYAYPEHVSLDALKEIRHLKARMEKERIPRGSDPRRNLKMGPGGMADIEFAAQVLQLQHAHAHEGLRSAATIDALRAATVMGLIPADESESLREAYRFYLRVRNRLFFQTGRPQDSLPARPEDVEALGIALGFKDQPRQQLEDTFLRFMRRTRRIAEPLIYSVT